MYAAARSPQLFVQALVSPVIGMLVIRYGARPLLHVSILLTGVVFLGFSRISELWHMYAIVGFMGLALAGAGDITVGQLVSQWVKKRRGLALGLVYTGSNLAGFIFVPFATGVAQSDGWRSAIFVMAMVALFAMLPLSFLLLRERPEAGVSEEEDEPTDAGRADDMDLALALRTRSFWILAVSLFTFFFYFIGMLEHLVLFLTDEGMPRDEAAGYFASALALGMLSKILLGVISDYIPQRTAVLLDFGLLALSSLVLLLLPASTPLMWAFVLSYGFATAARDVAYPLIITWCFGVRFMAQIYGAVMLALLPGGVLGPIFAAQVFDRLGSYDVAFMGFAGLNVAALLSLSLLRDERETAGAAEA